MCSKQKSIVCSHIHWRPQPILFFPPTSFLASRLIGDRSVYKGRPENQIKVLVSPVQNEWFCCHTHRHEYSGLVRQPIYLEVLVYAIFCFQSYPSFLI